MWTQAKLFLGASMLFLASFANAATWGPQTTITGYYVFDDASAYIKTAHTYDPGCGSTVYLWLDTTKPNFKALWAQVITAHAMGITVTVLYDGCSGVYPKVRAIAVPQSW